MDWIRNLSQLEELHKQATEKREANPWLHDYLHEEELFLETAKEAVPQLINEIRRLRRSL